MARRFTYRMTSVRLRAVVGEDGQLQVTHEQPEGPLSRGPLEV